VFIHVVELGSVDPMFRLNHYLQNKNWKEKRDKKEEKEEERKGRRGNRKSMDRNTLPANTILK
jgi:hypothetical protein